MDYVILLLQHPCIRTDIHRQSNVWVGVIALGGYALGMADLHTAYLSTKKIISATTYSESNDAMVLRVGLSS